MSEIVDLAFMRERNEQVILRLLRQEGPLSRADLARRSRLSRSTVSSIVAALLAKAMVHELGIGDSHGGRKPVMLEFNYRSSLVVGIDVASTRLTMLVTDLQATVLKQVHVPCNLADGPAICLPQIAQLFFTTLASLADQHQIGAVGIGVSAPLDSTTGHTTRLPVMPGWDTIALHEQFAQALGQPILLDNDANLGALAEHTWGAARGLFNAVYIHIGQAGIGGGLILDGNIYRGDIGAAGEIGHMMIEDAGPICRCGARGCLEALAGVPALLARSAHLGLAVATPGELVALAEAGNISAQRILAEAGQYLGAAIASVVNLLNPAGIIIGGALAGAGDYVLEPLQSVLVQRGLGTTASPSTLRLGVLGENVVALGATALAIRQVLNQTPMAHGMPSTHSAGRLATQIPTVSA